MRGNLGGEGRGGGSPGRVCSAVERTLIIRFDTSYYMRAGMELADCSLLCRLMSSASFPAARTAAEAAAATTTSPTAIRRKTRPTPASCPVTAGLKTRRRSSHGHKSSTPHSR